MEIVGDCVSFGGNGNALESESGDGCTTSEYT